MRTVELIERRRLLIGMGTLAIGGVVAKGATGPRAIKRPAAPSTWAAATRPASEEEDGRWTPVSPFERTILGALPPGAEATVRLRGAWGPLPWLNALGEGVHGERPRALAVARPVVQLLSADGRRELRRVAITQGSIAVSAPEGCQSSSLPQWRVINLRARPLRARARAPRCKPGFRSPLRARP
ncbi:MAG: hypothetical protein ABSF69_20465 [Polyangiaceae bacterium]|jgi:hypothetical protein